MRPLKLIMEGFGSYLSKTEIDFTLFGKNALFLITGNTGGGKTTILDAISFALYGKATGGERSWEQMRSIDADDSAITSVDFTFSLGGSVYRFVRSQSIYTGRRDGARKVKIENACYEIGESERLMVSGADKNVSNKAQELLGLDCSQFSRVMVLPQGEFRRLLLSSSGEKAELFEKLFNTEMWAKITELANKRADGARNELQRLSEQRQSLLASHGCEAAEQLEEMSEAAKKRYRELSKAAEATEKKLKTRRLELDSLKKRDELYAASEKLKSMLAAAENELIAAGEKLKGAEVEYERVPEIREMIDSLKIRENALAESVKSHSERESARRDLKACGEGADKARERENRLAAELKDVEERIKSGEEFLAECRRSSDLIASEEMRLRSLNEIDRNYKKLAALAAEKKSSESRFEAAADNYGKLSAELEALKERERSIDSRIRGDMAVFLSSTLTDGSPCPVCGSLTHPSPAIKSDEREHDLSKKLKDIREVIKEREREYSAAIKARSDSEAALIAARSAFEEQQRLCDGYNIYYKTFQKDIDRQSRLLSELKARAAKTPAAENRLDKLRKELDKIKSELDSNSAALLELEKRRAQLEEKISSLSKNISEGENPDAELIKCRSRYRELEALVEKATRELSSARAALEGKSSLVSERKKQLEEQRAELDSLNEVCLKFEVNDVDSANAICEELNQRLLAVIGESGEIKSRIERLDSALELLKNQQSQYEKAEKLYSSLSHISNILRGSNPMKTPIKMFVLGMMLDDILMQSNRYFAILSGGRYALEKSAEGFGGNSYKGLDIEVFDGSCGGKRSVATLSGGEMFLASLSLAFGLSDVVQGYSGGIRLDSIFIDEGFGSLDSETVDVAMLALDKIKDMGRTVGIISHVAQLREKIGNKIVVSSGARGSSAKVVTV